MTGPDPMLLRQAFGHFMTGVTVVTALDSEGAPVGFTANSFTSVSLNPPLLLVCPGRFLSSFPVFEGCDHFAVCVLAEDQEAVSNIFASFKGDRFAEVAWTANAQGVPLIDGAVARFSCRTAQRIEAGDHIVLIGEVLDVSQRDGRGLGYAGGKYFNLGLERAAASGPKPGVLGMAGAIVEHAGAVLLEETADGLRPPEVALDSNRQVRDAVKSRFETAGVPIALGAAFSIFDDSDSGLRHIYFEGSAKSPETGGLGRFHPIDDLARARFASDAHAAMLTRYADEYRTQSFGLYIGDESGGDIHHRPDPGK